MHVHPFSNFYIRYFPIEIASYKRNVHERASTCISFIEGYLSQVSHLHWESIEFFFNFLKIQNVMGFKKNTVFQFYNVHQLMNNFLHFLNAIFYFLHFLLLFNTCINLLTVFPISAISTHQFTNNFHNFYKNTLSHSPRVPTFSLLSPLNRPHSSRTAPLRI